MFLKVIKYFSVLAIGSIGIICLAFCKKDIPVSTLRSKYAPPPSDFIQVNGMNVHYRDQGNTKDSVPVILLHGTGASLHTWENCIQHIDKNRRIITLDLPAYGLTGPDPERDYSIGSYVSFIDMFVTSLSINKFVIGGNSLGGLISWNYALQYPEKVHKLILIDAAGLKSKSKSKPIAFKLSGIPYIKNSLLYLSPKFLARKSIENVYYDKSLVTQQTVNRYFDLYLREGNRQAFIDRMSASYNGFDSKSLAQLSKKTLIIWGENDELIPVENAFLFSKILPNDTLAIIEKCGHIPMEEKHVETAQAINSFIRF